MTIKNHNRVIKFILTAILSLLAILVIFWLVAATFFNAGCKDPQPQQLTVGAQKVPLLDKLIILTGIKTQSHVLTGGGDCLTGNPKNGWAQASFPTTGTLSQLKADVSKNLQNQGFNQSQPISLDSSFSNRGFSSATEIYSKDGTKITILYKFAGPHNCSEEKTDCTSSALNAANQKLLDAVISHVDVTYF